METERSGREGGEKDTAAVSRRGLEGLQSLQPLASCIHYLRTKLAALSSFARQLGDFRGVALHSHFVCATMTTATRADEDCNEIK